MSTEEQKRTSTKSTISNEQNEQQEQNENYEQYEEDEQLKDNEQHEDDEDDEEYEEYEQHEQHEQYEEVDEQNDVDEQIEDDEKQQRVHYDNDEVENVQEEETHQDLYQAVASSSTVESSNNTLRDDNVDHPPVIPRPIKQSTNRLSDRYTFSFSADLISQFDKYRAHMRESIRQELETRIFEEPEIEEIFSVHQVHHEPAGSMHSNSQNSREPSIKDRSTNNTPKSIQTRASSKKNPLKKYFGLYYLRGRLSKHRNTPTTTTTATTTTTLSDLATLSSDIDQHQPPVESSEERNSKGSMAKKYIFKIGNLFSKK